MTLQEILEQLKFCKFKDEVGHPLENNVAFVELQKLADEQDCRACPDCLCEDCQKETEDNMRVPANH